jgi:hypothetical protein
MRKCAECEKDKLETEFSPSQLAKNYSICRSCNTKMGKEYREKNKERLKEYDKQHDELFKECWALENLRPYSSKQNWLDGINRTRH